MNQLDQFRYEKDNFFKSDFQSPLTFEQKQTFKGLKYFPENPALRLEVKVKQFGEKEKIEMQTSNGDVQTYVRYGRFSFKVNGEPAELTIYATDHDFFLPFVDSLHGEETYGAGRYLEPQPLGEDRFLIDFNYAYNPYCAYNDKWSCPLPPFENRIKVPIKAGEKIFEVH